MFFAFLPLPHCSSFVCLGHLFHSSVSRPAGQAVPLYAMAQAATHPTAAVFGSPANSLGSALSQFLSHRTKYPSRKSKTPPKPQRKRHCRLRFLILRQLPPSGLSRTRSRLAPTASANRFVRSSLRYLQPLTRRLLKAVFPRTIHYYQQLLSKEENKNKTPASFRPH